MTDAAVPALHERLTARGWTIAAAESLTGGMLVSTLVGQPGISAVLRGGVVAYATEVKRDVLGVDATLLEAVGAVDRTVALQMADGVRSLLGADVGVATTGVAGPEPQDGRPVGTVCLAVVTPGGGVSEEHHLAGTRAEIRAAAVEAALRLALARV